MVHQTMVVAVVQVVMVSCLNAEEVAHFVEEYVYVGVDTDYVGMGLAEILRRIDEEVHSDTAARTLVAQDDDIAEAVQKVGYWETEAYLGKQSLEMAEMEVVAADMKQAVDMKVEDKRSTSSCLEVLQRAFAAVDNLGNQPVFHAFSNVLQCMFIPTYVTAHVLTYGRALISISCANWSGISTAYPRGLFCRFLRFMLCKSLFDVRRRLEFRLLDSVRSVRSRASIAGRSSALSFSLSELT